MGCSVPSVSFKELIGPPVAPQSGYVKLYALPDGKFYVKDSAGNDYDFLINQGVSTFSASMLDDASAGAVLTTLGVSPFVQTILNDANAAAVRTTISSAASGLNSDITTLDALGNVGSPVTFADSVTFSSTITVAGEFFDSTNSPGTAGQILSSTGTGTLWIDP